MKLCICCLKSFEVDQVNFYKILPGFEYAGKYRAICDGCNDLGREIYAGYLEIKEGEAGLKNAA